MSQLRQPQTPQTRDASKSSNLQRFLLLVVILEEANYLVKNIDCTVQIGGDMEIDEIVLGLRSLGLLINHTGLDRPILKGAELYVFTKSAKILSELFI